MTAAPFRIRRVDADTPAIWAAIVAMDAACFAHDSTPSLAENVGAWWIAYAADTDTPAGYCGIKKSSTGKNYGYLCRAGVLQRFRGHGLQRAMIHRRVAHARAQDWTHVVTDTNLNITSANNLIACGFRLYRPEVPWSFETALYWRKDLS